MLKKTLPWAVAAIAAVGVPAIAPQAASAKFGDKPLSKGSHGHDVKVLQRWLTLVGFRTSIDGSFGAGTQRALKRFERAHDLRADGRLTRPVARALRAQAYSVDPPGEQNDAKVQSTAATSGKVTLSGDGKTAVAPSDAPEAVKQAVAAANEITDKPYRYGGGHGSFEDSGYDCSGAVSYALHGAGLVDQPLDSSGFESWGQSGPGEWITVYATGAHAYVVIGGLRFDTSGSGDKGPRWRTGSRSGDGYVVRHPVGL